jgi:phosphatidate cytidylyltransferase
MTLNKRYLGAAIMLPLVIFLFLGKEYLFGITLVVSLFGMYEFYKVMKNKNINPLSIFAYIACLLYFYLVYNDQSLNRTAALNVIFLFVLLCVPVINTKYNIIDVAITYVGYIYICIFFSFIPLINMKASGAYLVWIPFVAAFSCDTLAYYTGRLLGKGGKHKLCPLVSPNKTVEGAIGGLLGSALITLAFGIIINKNLPIMSLYNYLIIGLICGVLCQFGDLVASSIKRYLDVKDYSKLIPGHGGILDRFDSILFASVVVYYYITFVVGI